MNTANGTNGNGLTGVGISRKANVISLTDDAVIINNLALYAPHVMEYLDGVPEGDRVRALTSATEVGFFCLERASNATDLDFVRERCEAVIAEVTRIAEKIPGEIEAELLKRVGSNDGQVLAPVKEMVEQATKATGESLFEVRDLLNKELDPDRESSTMARALKKINLLLTEDHPGSVQATVGAAVSGIAAADGALADRVAVVVTQQLKPLNEEVHRLALEVRGEAAASEALAQTTAKGGTFEEQTVAEVEGWASPPGAEVEHTGPDNGKGDVRVTPSELLAAGGGTEPIIIECRDRGDAVGRKPIGDTMEKAMVSRGATAGIFLAASPEGLAKEIGTWAEGRCARGIWVATTRENLRAALRMVLMLRRIEAAKAASAEFDEGEVSAQAARIRTSLKRIGEITKQVGRVRSAGDAIQLQSDELRSEVAGALGEIDDLIRRASRQDERAS
jgi:hypothetical protein